MSEEQCTFPPELCAPGAARLLRSPRYATKCHKIPRFYSLEQVFNFILSKNATKPEARAADAQASDTADRSWYMGMIDAYRPDSWSLCHSPLACSGTAALRHRARERRSGPILCLARLFQGDGDADGEGKKTRKPKVVPPLPWDLLPVYVPLR